MSKTLVIHLATLQVRVAARPSAHSLTPSHVTHIHAHTLNTGSKHVILLGEKRHFSPWRQVMEALWVRLACFVNLSSAEGFFQGHQMERDGNWAKFCHLSIDVLNRSALNVKAKGVNLQKSPKAQFSIRWLNRFILSWSLRRCELGIYCMHYQTVQYIEG